MEVEFENPASQLTVFGREESELQFYDSFLLILVIKEVTFNRVRDGFMLNKGIDIIAAFSHFFVTFLANNSEPRWVLGDLEQKCFVEH